MPTTFWATALRVFGPLRRPIRRSLLRFLQATESATATSFDVYFAHRLLADRALTPEEWSTWEADIEANRVSFVELVLRASDSRMSLTRQLQLDGYVLVVNAADPSTGRQIAETHTFEPHVTEHFRQAVAPDSTVLDVGANMGWFTLLAARLAPRGRVIAVEAHPANVDLIRQSVAANGFTQVEIWPIAAAERSGLLTFAMPDSNGYVTAADDPNPPTARRVPAIALDELLQTAERLDVVKLDIEGFEPYAVRGLARALRRFRPIVFTEFHPWIMRSREPGLAEGYLRFWRDLGYALSVILPDVGLLDNQSDAQIWACWTDVNARAGATDGRHHLDLLARPAR